MEDKNIVQLYFDRNERAITETSMKYGRYCSNIAMNILNNHEDAEECVNDTYLNTWNSIPPHKPNGVEIVDSFSAQYIVGDKFILNVTVSKDLEKYYETIPEEQLLKSLELTLTSYQQIEFDEYNLILE